MENNTLGGDDEEDAEAVIEEDDIIIDDSDEQFDHPGVSSRNLRKRMTKDQQTPQ